MAICFALAVQLLSNSELGLKKKICCSVCAFVVTGYGKSTKLSNCKFHERVTIDASRSLSFHPPEGEVVLAVALFMILFANLLSQA